jgi:hypothetical protein
LSTAGAQTQHVSGFADGKPIQDERFPRHDPVTTARERLIIRDSRAVPAISEFGLCKVRQAAQSQKSSGAAGRHEENKG